MFDYGSPFRGRLVRLQQDAADDGRYEDAIRFRDGVRALDRAVSTMSSISEALARDAIMVEEHKGEIVVHLIRGGLRAAVLIGSAESVGAKIERTLERVYFSGAKRPDPLRLPPTKIGELLTVASFEHADSHLEISPTDLAETLSRVRRALGLDRLAALRRHEAASAG